MTFGSPSFDSMGRAYSPPRAALQVKCGHQEFDPISPPIFPVSDVLTVAAFVRLTPRWCAVDSAACSASAESAAQTPTPPPPPPSLCTITHLLDLNAARCIDTRAPRQRKHMRRCRLAQLKVQLPRKKDGGGGGLQELGCKTNRTDKQATFGGDSVPRTPEIKKKAPCRFNTPQLNL